MKLPPLPCEFSRPDQRQRGAATLVIVMILFFIMTMMAAFASRNLVFEQRMASNFYRAGLAFEVAEAGAEWSLGMLNGLTIDAACLPTAELSTSFRQRYLALDVTSRAVTARPGSAIKADCVRQAGEGGGDNNASQGWVCRCPVADWTAPAAGPAATVLQPSFNVAFQTPFESRAGSIRLLSSACTGSLAADCAASASDAAMGSAQVSIDVALVSALKMPPAAPLTVKGSVTVDASTLGLHNTDAVSGGLLLLSGAALPANLSEARLNSMPGTPGLQAVISADGGLAEASPDQMFALFFGMSAAQYRDQPAMRRLICAAGSDCGPALATAYRSGARLLWVDGPLNLSSNLQFQADADAVPLLIIANGTLTLDGPMLFKGLIYARGHGSWANPSALPALLIGALLIEGNFQATGAVDLWYQAGFMDELKNRYGSFVRVPGSWWN
jgi:hypothetical protein